MATKVSKTPIKLTQKAKPEVKTAEAVKTETVNKGPLREGIEPRNEAVTEGIEKTPPRKEALG